jgi:hypothetical protein
VKECGRLVEEEVSVDPPSGPQQGTCRSKEKRGRWRRGGFKRTASTRQRRGGQQAAPARKQGRRAAGGYGELAALRGRSRSVRSRLSSRGDLRPGSQQGPRGLLVLLQCW